MHSGEVAFWTGFGKSREGADVAGATVGRNQAQIWEGRRRGARQSLRSRHLHEPAYQHCRAKVPEPGTLFARVRPRTFESLHPPRDGTNTCSVAAIRHSRDLKGTNKAEADIVVAVRRLVVVAIGDAAVLRVVVPRAAAVHAVVALMVFAAAVKVRFF